MKLKPLVGNLFQVLGVLALWGGVYLLLGLGALLVCAGLVLVGCGVLAEGGRI